MSSKKANRLTRRNFLALTGLTAAAGLAACAAPAAPKAAEPTKAPEAAKAAEPTAAPEPTKPPEPTAAPAAKESVFIVGRGGDSVGLDPAILTDGESARVCNPIYDTLTRYEGKVLKVVPWLAESWTTADSKVWDFKLRQGVKFHDGEPLNAQAVKFNFDRWQDPKNPNRFPSQKYEYWDIEFGSIVDTTEVVDDYTFRITLKEPTALILVKLQQFNFAIASPKAIQAQGEKYATQAGTPVGTGPFKFEGWVPNDKITLVRNDDWWGGKANLAYTQLPIITKLIFRSIPDNSTRFAELQAGTLDQADLAQTDMMTLEGNPDYQKVVSPSMGVGYINFNVCTKPFDKVEVRQAFAYGVNWQGIVDNFYGGLADRAAGFTPPAILGSNPDLKPYPYDPDKAKELLKTAGLEGGFKSEFWYIPVIRGYFPDSKAIAEAMSADLAKIGIMLDLKTKDWGPYLDDRKEGKFPVWMLGWGSDNGDPDNFIGYHFIYIDGKTPNKEDCYANPKLQELLNAGRVESDVTKRDAIYREAEKIVYDELPRVPVAWPKGVGYWPTRVKNLEVWLFRDRYEYIYAER